MISFLPYPFLLNHHLTWNTWIIPAIVPMDGKLMMISSTTTPPPQTSPLTIHSHPFPLMTTLIENSIMTPPQNSFLISKRKRPQMMIQTLQNLLFLMINPFLTIKLIGNPMMMIRNFICTKAFPLLLRLGSFPKISTTPPPRLPKRNLPRMMLQPS